MRSRKLVTELSPVEKKVFNLLIKGKKAVEIAEKMKFSISRSRAVCGIIYRKKNVDGQVELLAQELA